MSALVYPVALAIGAAIGLSRIVTRRLPLVLTAIPLFAYCAFIAWYGVRTAACPHCDAGDGDRLYYLPLYAAFYGSILAALLAGVAAGVVAAHLVTRGRSQPI